MDPTQELGDEIIRRANVHRVLEVLEPLYGYFLFYWAYKPLRAVLPRPAAAWLTFLVSGLVLHDMIGWTLGRRVQAPTMTIMFALLGGVAVRDQRRRSVLALVLRCQGLSYENTLGR